MQQTPNPAAHVPDTAPPRSAHSEVVMQVPFVYVPEVLVHTSLGN